MIAGRYSLDREIGRGGMGAVWLGRDEVLGRPVAVKRIGLAPGMVADGATVDHQRAERAEREARLAARLSHPHVVAVFDLVDEDGAQWLVMEYVEGSTLAQLVRDEGALSLEDAASVVGQAADGLAAAHAAGIVHRDVKPSNILVTHDGQVKLSDFGIARAEADPSLTQTGLVTGSPAYLAPEVASGRTATDASDVWSIGATLFHALSGHPPYEVGENLLGTLYRIVHEEPPRLPDAGWLAPLLEATMTREPADRWTMAQVRDVLQAGPGAPLPGPARRTRVLAHDPETTQAMPSLSAAVPSGTPATAAATATAGSAAPAAEEPRGRRWVVPALLLATLAALVGVVAFVLGLGDDDPERLSTAPSTSSRPIGGSPSGSPSEGATVEGMTRFVEDYLTTAAEDSQAGFAMLTPQFQAESGDFAGYDGFWGAVERVRDIEVSSADPESLVVSYSYTYQLEQGPPVEDNVSLQLAYRDGGYLVAGEPD